MTWEDTIQLIRTKPEYNDLVEKAYFDSDLQLNVKRFSEGQEYKETLVLIKKHAPQAQSILDVGCGNGISAVNFAKEGYQVTAVEPDPSKSVGAGAIEILKSELQLDNISVFQNFAEDIKFPDNNFDVVYIRQAMHHANHLNNFLKECIRVLKPGGLLLTIRDHVIFNHDDKDWFLKEHPLHKFYGGENAYTAKSYKQAITNGGASIVCELKYYDSVINYFPITSKALEHIQIQRINGQKKKLQKKLGLIANNPLAWWLYKLISGYKALNEKEVPGRMYSYIAIKK